ncbi:MAG: hypothetical protein GHCLOJNM_01193 [bacterium]|nr:hypothetical protein [bacterium]
MRPGPQTRENHMLRFLLAPILCCSFALAAFGQTAPAPGKQEPQLFEKEVKVRLQYLLYLPEEYGKEPDKKWPLILFLHGMGERGDDLEKVKEHGPPKLIAEGKQFPFIVVSPQCPRTQFWVTGQLFLLLDEITEKYAVDKARVYLTGLSMGGFGTWAAAAEQPERFAAIAPICGGGEPAMAWRLRRTPIWAFHGAKDETVPLERSQQMVDAVKKAGGNVEFTLYPEAQHDSWTETYNNPKLYEWFLSHSRK